MNLFNSEAKQTAPVPSIFQNEEEKKDNETTTTQPMEEEDPLDAYMRKIDAETKAGMEESNRKDYENMQRYFQEEEEKERQNQAPLPTITLDDIINNENKDESTQMDEEEEEKYHKAFKEAIQRANEEEEKKQRQEKTEKMLQNGLGYTEMQDDYVEEYVDEVNEMTALEQLQKKIHNKVMKTVDHEKIDYIPIRKNLYTESPLISKMTDVGVVLGY